MIISCPNCSTSFDVPEASLGERGRTLKCARCAFKWFHPSSSGAKAAATFDFSALMAEESENRQPAVSPAASRAAAPEPKPYEAKPFELNLDLDFDEPPQPKPLPMSLDLSLDFGDDKPRGLDDFFMTDTPEPIPEVFSSAAHRPKARPRGAWGLWLLLLVLVLVSASSAAYFYQEAVIGFMPELDAYYRKAGLRKTTPGAGLAFRNYSSERLVQESTEVLLVRGVIVNTTQIPRDVPLLRLALYDNDKLVQEKVVNPPAVELGANATVTFRVVLDQPNAQATRFEVSFTEAKDKDKKDK